MAALAENAEQRYLDRLVALVADAVPPGESAPRIREMCRELVRRARSHGFTTEFEIAIYVACGFVEGIDFDLRDDLPYRRITASSDMSHRSKAEMLALILENAAVDEAGEDEA